MNVETSEKKKLDTGLLSLAIIARIKGKAVDIEQLRHSLALGEKIAGVMDLQTACKLIGFKVKAVKATEKNIARKTFPFL